MNAPRAIDIASASEFPVFDDEARLRFAEYYPETPHVLKHGLASHPLLELGSLASLAERIPESSIEYSRGDLPVGIEGKLDSTGLSIGETIRAS